MCDIGDQCEGSGQGHDRQCQQRPPSNASMMRGMGLLQHAEGFLSRKSARERSRPVLESSARGQVGGAKRSLEGRAHWARDSPFEGAKLMMWRGSTTVIYVTSRNFGAPEEVASELGCLSCIGVPGVAFTMPQNQAGSPASPCGRRWSLLGTVTGRTLVARLLLLQHFLDLAAFLAGHRDLAGLRVD